MTPLRALVPSLGLLAGLAGATPARAGTLYVDASLTTGADDGSSWMDAFQGADGLQRALRTAPANEVIWVARGTYLPSVSGARDPSFEIANWIVLYGGFAGGETTLGQRDPVANETILSGDLLGDDARGSDAENSYHVVRIARGWIDGFTITGGNADGPGDVSGGGVLVEGTPAVLRYCAIRGNRARAHGGGVYLGDRLVTPTFEHCVFSENTARAGSALAMRINSRAAFLGCLLHGNTATGTYDAGTVYMDLFSETSFYACTLAANRATSSVAAGLDGASAMSYAAIYGSIVYFNTGHGGAQGSPSQIHTFATAYNSCVQGGDPFGPDSISIDPQMVNVAGGDFRLSPSSPCVDAGMFAVYSAYDLDRAPRLQDVPSAPDTGSGTGPIMDMGAYEASGDLYELTCPGDGTQPTSCPCANDGLEGRGCRHSHSYVGTVLVASGSAQPDEVLLTASDMPHAGLCLFLQGDAHIDSGVLLGDGVRCVSGTVKRIGTAVASSEGDAQYPGPADPSISARSAALGDPIPAGSMRWYQAWYRDEAPWHCPEPQGGTSNVTSGIGVRW